MIPIQLWVAKKKHMQNDDITSLKDESKSVKGGGGGDRRPYWPIQMKGS
jgi:hypothetical protein